MVLMMDSNYKTKTTKTSRSIDQNKLKILCDKLADRAEELFNFFDIEYIANDRYISCSCPIHGGDNATALNLYYVGDEYRGNWKCRTHHCEKVFMGSIIGFVRGVLSHKKLNWRKKNDDTVSFIDTIKFAIDFLQIKDLNSLKSEYNPNASFIATTKILKQETKAIQGISRERIRNTLRIPSQYFIGRGFSKEVLDKYDVGDCDTVGKEMYGRAVAPIYDHNYRGMIGCTGRTRNEEYKPKWRHNSGFQAEDHLYNLWFAKDHILKNNEIILVESPGNVWKLEENRIHNSVATFGAHLTDKQKMLLDITGAMKIIVIMDNDEAGEIARKQIDQKCSKTYNIEHIRLSKNDVVDLTAEELQSQILSRILR